MAGHCLRLEKSISIHALREEGDFNTVDAIIVRKQFLSTPSARRATECPSPDWARLRYFYPRPPRGGRPKRPDPSRKA